jgi:hypothetical protein
MSAVHDDNRLTEHCRAKRWCIENFLALARGLEPACVGRRLVSQRDPSLPT